MGEFSPVDMPEPDFSPEIPDVEPSIEVVDDAPASVEFTPDTPIESEPLTESSAESDPFVDSTSGTESKANNGALIESDPVVEDNPDSQIESSTEIAAEGGSDTTPDLEPESISGMPADISPDTTFEPSPEIVDTQLPIEQSSLEEEGSTERSPDEMSQGLPFQGPEQTELYHSPETTKEIEAGTGPNPSWDQPPDGSVNDTFDDKTVGEEDSVSMGETGAEEMNSAENPESDQDANTNQSDNLSLDAERDVTLADDIPSETVDTPPVMERSGLSAEGTAEQSMEGTANDTPSDLQQESSPKFYLNGEEVTLPGAGEREYRIGSPHQDYEDYKDIVDANRQHDLGFAAQTSDSFGEAVGTLAEAQQGGTDFTKTDTYMYEKFGPTPYTDAAYPRSDNSSNSASIQADNSSEREGSIVDSPADSPVPTMPVDMTSFTDSQERNIAVRRWGEEKFIQLRAYDTELGEAPENPNIGTAGMTNLLVETGLEGSTQIRLQDIVIPRDYRESGIAGNMLDQTIEIAKAKGASEVYGVIENEEALSYWKHMEDKGSGWKVDPSQGAHGYVRYDMSSFRGKK